MRMGAKGDKQRGQTKDVKFRWATEINSELEQWRILAEEWLKTIRLNKVTALRAMSKFLNKYIQQEQMSTIPSEFLSVDYPAKSFDETCLSHMKSSQRPSILKYVDEFVDWVLDNYFSVENDNGIKIIPSTYHNPISLDLKNNVFLQTRADESNKNVLPYRYIKQLRTNLCPEDAIHFRDWKSSQKAMDTRTGGDWFVAERTIIDRNDSNCVWRERKATRYELETKGLPEVVYELWSPVRAVALYIKLLLPLKTYQVRVLDSGEADTFRYEQLERQVAGQWSINQSSLKEGSEKYPFRRGFFRQFIDPVTHIEMTGLYINTNKTADIGKDEWSKGYEVPWQHEEALYWMAKLRNWKEKYNPIERPTAWIELGPKHIGFIKDQSILKQMGTTCFLFR